VAHTAIAALLCALLLAPAGAGAAVSGRALQEKRLEAGKTTLERLRGDARKRKRRDAWEAVIRELDGAVRAAPGGTRAAEAALLAARAREELWHVSRSRRDAVAAIAAYRKVDEAYTGSPQAPRALLSATRLAERTRRMKSAVSAARRLVARYGGTPEADAVAAVARIEAPRPAPRGAKPVDLDQDEEDADGDEGDDAESAPPGGQQVARGAAQTDSRTAVKSGAAGRQPAPAPAPAAARAPAAGGEQADEAEVPAAAAKLLDQVIEAAKGQAKAVGGSSAPSSNDDADELPPEPEAPEPIRGMTVKAALPPPPREETKPARVVATAKALKMRAAARKAPASVAAQLALKVRRVVIDPGHGGRDTGAIGPHGAREKDVALAIGRNLAERLRALGFAVVLTRKDDSYVSLDERTRIANEARADLFVSVHCNAARSRTLSGVETWTLNVASDRYSTRLATFENADAERTVSDLRLILADLATRANTSDARDLAQSVQGSLVRNLRSRFGRVGDHGVKQALFYVLLGAHMPAILVETGFISNPVEEKRLRGRKYQVETAEAIARGVKEFVDGRQRLARAP
jgi:N-acetylmuramoyl-L-alanine amidase